VRRGVMKNKDRRKPSVCITTSVGAKQKEGIMRKCFSMFVALCTAVLISTSSVAAAERPSFGVLGGVHLANIAIDPDPTDASLNSITRANFGGLVEFDLTPYVSLQARGMYVPKGTSLDDLAEEVDLSATTVIDYITVPLLLKIQAKTGKIRPYAVVGPEIGFKARAGVSLTTTASVPGEILNRLEKELTDQVNNELKSIDVALDFGGGIEIPSGRMSVLVEGIYSLGLRNIAVSSEGDDGSAKTRAFLFNVGIRF
jgi:hypothetical protein